MLFQNRMRSMKAAVMILGLYVLGLSYMTSEVAGAGATESRPVRGGHLPEPGGPGAGPDGPDDERQNRQL